MYMQNMFLSLLIAALAFTTGHLDFNPAVEEAEVIQGTFKELVTDKYLERARNDEFDAVAIIRDDGKKHAIKSIDNQETIYRLLDYFNNLNLVEGATSSSLSVLENELYYEIWFKNTKEFEQINITTNKDNELITYIVFHLIDEDKEKKLIVHERDYVMEEYTLVGEKIDFDFLDEIFGSIEE